MRWLALLLPLAFGFGQRPAPVAFGDLNGDGNQDQVYLEQVRPYRPGNYDDGVMPQPRVSTLRFSDQQMKPFTLHGEHSIAVLPDLDGNGTDDLVVAEYPDINTRYEVHSWDPASQEWNMLLWAVRPMGGLPDSTWVSMHSDTIYFRTTTCTILPSRMEVDHRDTTRCELRVKWLGPGRSSAR